MKFVKLLLLIPFLSLHLLAANGNLPGAGTENAPYLIEDVTDFLAFCQQSQYNQENVYTKLTTDLDLGSLDGSQGHIVSGYRWDYNYNNCYGGVFDGDGHSIINYTLRNFLIGTNFHENVTAMFPVLTSTGVVKNLTIKDAYIESNTYDTGTLCGRNWGTIDNCHVTGYLQSGGKIVASAGLLLANNASDGGIVTNSSAIGTVIQYTPGSFFAGGFCGANESIITNCYSNVDVTGDEQVGAFCGWSDFDNNARSGKGIKNCYAAGSVTGRSDVGGFVGYNDCPLENCYTTASVNPTGANNGGFVGRYDANSIMANSFWNAGIYNSDDIYTNLNYYHFAFEEMTGTEALNSGVSTATANIHGASWSSEGKVGNCLSFDGWNDYLTVNLAADTAGENPRTLSTWVKTGVYSRQVICCWGDRVDGQLWQVNIESDGKVRLLAIGGNITSAISIHDGQWHHVAVVLPSVESPKLTDVQIYIDGILDDNAIASSSVDIDTGNTQMTIGMNYINGVPYNYFEGSLDEFYLYSKALSAEDITLLANLQEPDVRFVLSGSTTAQMQDINTYLNADWDIVPEAQADEDSMWVMPENGYPVFTWSDLEPFDTVYFDPSVLSGLSEAEAVDVLTSAGISADIQYDYSSTVAPGYVVSYDRSNTIIRVDQSVLTIIVSSGPYDWSTNPGNGTLNAPYEITTPGMLFALPNDQFYYFTLMNDLDLKAYFFENGCVVQSDMGDSCGFMGSFNGNGCTISNAAISSVSYYDIVTTNKTGLHGVAGFFAAIYGTDTVVCDLQLENINLSVGESNNYAGCFVGVCDSIDSIYNCSVSGIIAAGYSTTSSSRVGGFVGYGSNINSCYSNCSIFISDNIGHGAGFVAYGENISNCCSLGNACSAGGSAVAGFVNNVTESGTISNCYCAVSLSKADADSRRYAFVESNTVSNCLWDFEVCTYGSDGWDNNGAIGKTTEKMQNIATYLTAGWDICTENSSGVWLLPENSYPILRGERTIYYAGNTNILLSSLYNTAEVNIEIFGLTDELQFWTIENDSSCPWIYSIYPDNGITIGVSDKLLVTIKVNTGELSDGVYSTSLKLLSSNGSVTDVPLNISISRSATEGDLVMLAAYWLQSDCQSGQPCSEADFISDGSIDMYDFGQLAENWLK